MKKWFTIEELAAHNSPFDCYVSIYGTVYDLTHLIPQHSRALSQPLLQMAGKDISHWFEPRTADMTTGVELLMEFDPQMQITTYCIPPKGKFIHFPPMYPCNVFNMEELPWWKDPDYMVGKLSERSRFVRIRNVMTEHTDLMEVPMEETINQIMERYVNLNAHALSYEALKLCTCDTHEGKVFVALDMNKSLEENGVFDESLEYGEMGMEINHLIPVMDVHYTDDLTVA
ncbi:hypothetical protein BDL97_03G062100 [Sphagnum fallax]|nr:hypothetical protein BDL97_03G062100 [Sphagnum fallax]